MEDEARKFLRSARCTDHRAGRPRNQFACLLNIAIPFLINTAKLHYDTTASICARTREMSSYLIHLRGARFHAKPLLSYPSCLLDRRGRYLAPSAQISPAEAFSNCQLLTESQQPLVTRVGDSRCSFLYRAVRSGGSFEADGVSTCVHVCTGLQATAEKPRYAQAGRVAERYFHSISLAPSRPAPCSSFRPKLRASVLVNGGVCLSDQAVPPPLFLPSSSSYRLSWPRSTVITVPFEEDGPRGLCV